MHNSQKHTVRKPSIVGAVLEHVVASPEDLPIECVVLTIDAFEVLVVCGTVRARHLREEHAEEVGERAVETWRRREDDEQRV